jgi:hypothetical protein
VNGTFETGNISGWTSSVTLEAGTTTYCNNPFAAFSSNSGCGSLSAPVDGVYDAFASSSVPENASPASVYDELTQSFTGATGFSQALLTFDAEASCTTSTNGCYVGYGLYLGSCTTCFASGDSALASAALIDEFSQTISWSSYSSGNLASVLNAHPGATFTLDFIVGSFTWNGSGSPGPSTVQSAAFDDVELTLAPEPSTVVLLAAGLGTLGWLGRKRANPSSRHRGGKSGTDGTI